MESFGQSLSSNQIDFTTGAVWLAASLLCGGGAGSLSALKLAGKDIGNELASMMGSVFGAVAAVPGILVGLIVLKFI